VASKLIHCQGFQMLFISNLKSQSWISKLKDNLDHWFSNMTVFYNYHVKYIYIDYFLDILIGLILGGMGPRNLCF
jgi:hypothetical protein